MFFVVLIKFGIILREHVTTRRNILWCSTFNSEKNRSKVMQPWWSVCTRPSLHELCCDLLCYACRVMQSAVPMWRACVPWGGKSLWKKSHHHNALTQSNQLRSRFNLISWFLFLSALGPLKCHPEAKWRG